MSCFNERLLGQNMCCVRINITYKWNLSLIRVPDRLVILGLTACVDYGVEEDSAYNSKHNNENTKEYSDRGPATMITFLACRENETKDSRGLPIKKHNLNKTWRSKSLELEVSLSIVQSNGTQLTEQRVGGWKGDHEVPLWATAESVFSQIKLVFLCNTRPFIKIVFIKRGQG